MVCGGLLPDGRVANRVSKLLDALNEGSPAKRQARWVGIAVTLVFVGIIVAAIIWALVS